ncbi:MarC family protein [Rhodopila sp.]|uniref:MarC family protein n=1 Tax=Rhodopila sp. TaxID=2480087 RepID=UPI002CC8E7DD|nr:MarC family protein [Rhodopila sp.]HVZ07766.1 MarC family protein [Rhodopila sp.]
MQSAVNAFLLGFPALFSIVNPISGALIFQQMTGHLPQPEQARLARQVAVNCLIVMIAALWAGSYVLAFFGISLAALRVAGGSVVALTGWTLMNAPDKREEHKQEQASHAGGEDIALFPLTVPITTGPGSVAVAIALGAGHPWGLSHLLLYELGLTTAAVALSGIIWLFYRSAERVTGMMGPNGRRTVTRVAAFLLLCIGVQILISGVQAVISGDIAP